MIAMVLLLGQVIMYLVQVYNFRIGKVPLIIPMIFFHRVFDYTTFLLCLSSEHFFLYCVNLILNL